MRTRNRKIGIEIENESFNISIDHANRYLSQFSQAAWEIERDGSLRGGSLGWEIKTVRGGMPFDAVSRALNDLYPLLTGCSGVWRAAVHVHVDCTDLTHLQRVYVMCLAYAMDESIFKLVGEERRESNFCVPLANKRWHVLNFISDYAENGSILDSHGYGKYSSINASSLRNFGTIEFRHMRTPSTGDSISSVTEALEQIRRYAMIAHDIVDAVRYTEGTMRIDEVLPRFLDVVSNDFLWQPLGIKANMEHVLDIVNLFHGHTQLPKELDLGSLYTVSMPSARSAAGDHYVPSPAVSWGEHPLYSSQDLGEAALVQPLESEMMDEFWREYLGGNEADVAEGEG